MSTETNYTNQLYLESCPTILRSNTCDLHMKYKGRPTEFHVNTTEQIRQNNFYMLTHTVVASSW